MSDPLPPAVAEESALLDATRTRLAKGRTVLTLDTRSLLEELDKLRDEIGTTPDEEKGPLLVQYERLMHLVEAQGKSITGQDVDASRPYFAHMRLAERGRERDIFLGRATRLDGGLRIVDWRHAPVSALFYRYAEGEEYDEDISGRHVEGRVVVRRILGIEAGALHRVQTGTELFRLEAGAWSTVDLSASRLSGGQGEALRFLDGATAQGRKLGGSGGVRAEKHLPDISALLDKDQFALVGDKDAQLVVVRGVAGSGKTTVMLHRMAFLAYAEPAHFRPDRMLCIVWGRAIRDYISRMLRGLGLQHVPVRTFSEWAQDHVRRLFPTLPTDRAEDTPAVVTRLKLHPAMLRVLEDWVRSRRRPATSPQVLDDWAELLTSRSALAAGLAQHAPGQFTEAEIDRVVRWAARQLDLLQQRRALRGRLAGAPPANKQAKIRDLDHQEHEFEDDVDILADDGPPEPPLDSEDDPLLLRLYQLRVGPLPFHGGQGGPLRYRHIAIDEVQDLSPLEVRILLDCTDARRSVTLSGDTQQHVLTEAGFASWEDFFSHLGVRGTSLSTLKVSYRSTKPILRAALDVLGPLAEDHEPPAAAREGAPVELFRFGDHGEAVAFLAEALRELELAEPLASVALLSRTPETADLYYQGMRQAGLSRIRRVEDQDFAFAPGIEVCDVAQSKGLEFDYVVLLDISQSSWPDTPAARRLLHVGMTRAAWQLWITWVGPKSPLLPPG